jgi:hypothetical protein
MDKNTVKSLRTDLESALGKVAVKYGVTLPVGTITFSPSSVRFSVKGVTVKNKKDAANPLAAAYAQYESKTGKKLGDTITLYGKKLTIVGAKPSNRKYPIIVEGARGGSYKVSVSDVKHAL